jgi:AcrR family transcriptional regulator
MATGNSAGPRRRSTQAVVDTVMDKVSEKVQAKTDRQLEKLDRVAAKVQAKADQSIDKVSRKLGADAPLDGRDLWMRTEPGSRRPRFRREEIAAAAVRIADTEGIDALSMRRLATELGSGTMTLYHYVRTKDELLALVSDAVMGEIVLPPEALPADDWRAAMTAIAHTSRAALERHLWIFDIVDDPAAGPNGVRHFDQSLQAVASMPGTLRDKFDVIFAVDEYVFGYCLHARDDHVSARAADDADTISYIAELVSGGDYPQIQALIDELGLDAAWTTIEEHSRDTARFDRNLRRLLDGLAADVDPPDQGSRRTSR